MTTLLKTIDRAADTLYEGFISEALGWRGAVLFFVLLRGLIPLGSLVNALWAGLILLVNWRPADFSWSEGEFYAICVGLVVVGTFGVWSDIKEMAARPVVDRAKPRWEDR